MILLLTEKKQRHYISLEVKLKVLKRIDNGERNVDIQQVMSLPKPILQTIRSNADTIDLKKCSVNSMYYNTSPTLHKFVDGTYIQLTLR